MSGLLSNPEVARQMHMSVNTVKTHTIDLGRAASGGSHSRKLTFFLSSFPHQDLFISGAVFWALNNMRWPHAVHSIRTAKVR